MSLSPGYFCLKQVDNAVHIARSIVNTRLVVADMGPVAYVFRDTAPDAEPAEAGDIPIFLQPEPYSNAPLIKDCAVLSLDSVTSTHSLLEALVKHGAFDSTDLLVTSKHQIQGRGRRGERVWSSPPGCAMFSFTHRFGIHSMIGEHMGFLQHLVSLSVVQSVPQIPDLKIKWPNDVYYKRSKVAGVVVNCHMGTKEVVALVGVGVNVDNVTPTDCLNRILREDLKSDQQIEPKDLISQIVLNFRRSAALLKSPNDFEEVRQSYMKRWMHTGQEMRYKGKDLVIKDVDEQGFLRVRPKDGGSEMTIGYDYDDVSLLVT